MRLMGEDAQAQAVRRAIRGGDLNGLARLLGRDPALATAVIEGPDGRTCTPLHLAAEWPGYLPDSPAAVELLIGAGADPDALTTGGERIETSLHLTASTDDVDVAIALVAGGADLEGAGASRPLEDAIGYGCWHVARYLVDRGARVEHLWVAAALGLRDRVDALLPASGPEELTEAFWQACHGGQRRLAARLLAAGADLRGQPPYAHGPASEVAARLDTRREGLATWLRELGG